MTTVFETETCSRCGGSGHYSFNGEHSRCYKCDGKNNCMAYTKRGAAAKAYYLNKLNVPVSSIKVGDLISCNALKLRVTAIEVKPNTAIVNGQKLDGNQVILIGTAGSLVLQETSTVRLHP